MRKRFHHGVTRCLARVLLPACALLFLAPPAVAVQRARWRPARTQTPDAELRPKIQAREAERKQPDVMELSDKEMSSLFGRGQYRNRGFSGVLPWQPSLRDVNLCNGNLFKSFTDVQVAPARGAGLAFQRSYNSNDDRVGAFGVGWTHAYDIFIEEAGNNIVERVDFFGGEHRYTRDADGLYSPPPYLYDELSSEYLNTLVNGPAEVATDEQRGMDGTVKHFFRNGDIRNCDWIEDRHGNRSVLTYGLSIGSRSLLTRVTDPSGRYLEIGWTNLNLGGQPTWRITQVQGPFDPGTGLPVYTVIYEYNAEGNLWKVRQDPSGLNRVTTYTYATVSGESGLLASISDPLGHAVSYAYSLPTPNFTGTLWVSQVTEPGSGGNHVWTITPSLTGSSPPIKVDAVSNAGLGVTVHSDAQFRKVQLGQYNGYAWNQWQSAYDSANNEVLVHRVTFNPTAQFLTAIQTTLNRTFGPHANVLTEGFQGYPSTTTSYYNGTKYFQKATVTDPNGNVSEFDYFDKNDQNPGNRGQVKWVRDARYSVTGEQFEYTYNPYGQKLTEINLNNVPTHYTYGDVWGNLTQVVQDPGTGKLNRTTLMGYDVAGRVASSTDPKSQPSSFSYNGVGQPLQANLPGETVTYGYGANGRTQSVTDGRGTTTIGYESGNDRVASVTDPVTGTVGYTHGLAGERATLTLPGGGTWTYGYGNRLQMQQLLPQDDPNSACKMLTTVTDDQNRAVEYWLDQFGMVHRVENNRTYDAGGSLVSFGRTHYTLEFSSGLTRRVVQQVRNTWHSKNAMGQWTESVLVGNDYGHDNAGQRLTNTISDSTGPIRTETYGYDPLSRLTSVNYGDGQTQGYTFDPMGNRLTKTDNVAGNDTYTHNAANMLLSRNGGAYTNDLNGNTLTGGGRTNTWDGQNRLTACTFNGTTTTHAYGSDGLRRRTVQGANTTDYVLEGQSAIRTLLNGAVDKTYLHGARGPEYERLGANDPVWYLYDGLGSVLGTVDKNGNVVSTRKYDVYGGVRGSTGPSGTKHKFVGGLGHPSEDETGLVYMRARYCDPLLGRFAGEDPAFHGMNWFLYASNNPVNVVDLSGKTGKGINDMFDVAGWIHGLSKWCSPTHWVAAAVEWISLKKTDPREREVIGRRGEDIIQEGSERAKRNGNASINPRRPFLQ